MLRNMPLRGIIYSKFVNMASFAKALGWSRQRLDKIVNGRKIPSLDDVRHMADVLGVEFMVIANIFLRKESPNGDKAGGEE